MAMLENNYSQLCIRHGKRIQMRVWKSDGGNFKVNHSIRKLMAIRTYISRRVRKLHVVGVKESYPAI
jgi:hypothetical protein